MFIKQDLETPSNTVMGNKRTQNIGRKLYFPAIKTVGMNGIRTALIQALKLFRRNDKIYHDCVHQNPPHQNEENEAYCGLGSESKRIF